MRPRMLTAIFFMLTASETQNSPGLVASRSSGQKFWFDAIIRISDLDLRGTRLVLRTPRRPTCSLSRAVPADYCHLDEQSLMEYRHRFDQKAQP